MCAGAFSGAFFNHAMKNLIASNQVRFILALFVGAAVAAVFGILIGIPVLRLKGDYLAIVTLAFGEIVKNIINVLYVGIDGNGIHVSMKDVASLKLAADGQVIIKGAQGITGTPKTATFTIGIILVLLTLFIVLNIINSRTGRAIMVCGYQYHEIQTDGIYHLCFLSRCGRRSVRTQPGDAGSDPEKLRL